MAEIIFTARKGTNKVNAATAKEAVQAFLTQFKNREFSVTEYRDGKFTAALHLDTGTMEYGSFYRKFASRDEARAFCAD